MFEPTPGEMLTAAGVAELERNAPADVVDALPVPRLIEADLPPEPGVGAVVIGKTGRAFQRFHGLPPHPVTWFPATETGRTAYGVTWPELLAHQTPMWLVQGERPEAVQP